MKMSSLLVPAADVWSFFKIICLIAVGIFFYFVPTLLAVSRKHPSATAILMLNLLLGWTGLGWIIALVWGISAIDAERNYR